MKPPMLTNRLLQILVVACMLSGSSAATAQGVSPSFASEQGPAEEEDEIETDRDSFTPATTTAGDKRWIVETAY